MQIDSDERRVLKAVSMFEPVGGRDFIREDLRSVFDRLVARGLIMPVYALSKEGCDAIGVPHDSDD